MLQSRDSIELLKSVEVKNLYTKLILQLNKDFLLANLNTSFDLSATPVNLKQKLSDTLLNLITNQYDDYLNLLYRIDISERELLKIKSESLPTVIDQLTYVLLKREYQKVWFRNTL